MLSGVMLIIVTMFAVLGAYFLSEVLTECLFKGSSLQKTVVILAKGSLEQVWNSILDVRTKLPNCEIVVLCEKEPSCYISMEPALRGVSFATRATLDEAVCTRLYRHLQDAENAI